MRGKKPTSRVDNPEADLLSAVRDIGTEHKKDLKRKKKRGGPSFLAFMPGWLLLIIKILLVVIVVLIADGIRRESKEFSATIVSYTGICMIAKDDNASPAPPVPNMRLVDKNLVITGPSSTATIVFSDGSAVMLEPNTQFRVRLMDYARGGKRDRSFMVESGSIVARVSKFFGVDSRATVCTPNAVAAARGTGFRVAYYPQSMTTDLQVVDGTVAFQSGYDAAAVGQGQSTLAEQYNMAGLRGMKPVVQASVQSAVGGMRGYEAPPNALAKAEQAINNFLDPLMQLLGLSPGGWGYNSVDFARRGACVEALRRMRTHIEEVYSNGVPEYVNPVTLAQLNLNPVERDRLLGAFYGAMLESYEKTGQDRFVIYARARDKKHTLYQLTEAAMTVVKE